MRRFVRGRLLIYCDLLATVENRDKANSANRENSQELKAPMPVNSFEPWRTVTCMPPEIALACGEHVNAAHVTFVSSEGMGQPCLFHPA
jgi:hypothetical protein